MAAIENNDKPKQKHQTKYAGLSEEEKKIEYKKRVKAWYTDKTPEEKQEFIKRVMKSQHGYCEICGKEYAQLPTHRRTYKHIKKMEQLKK